jgi:hypothetical protein
MRYWLNVYYTAAVYTTYVFTQPGPEAGIRAELGKAVADLRLMMMLNSDKFQRDSHDEGTEELKRLTACALTTYW